MNRRPLLKSLFAGSLLSLALSSQSLFACAACYGQSDSRLAVGMNWGIGVLLAVVGSVLCGFAGAGVYFVKRAAKVAAITPPGQPPQATDKV